jgi:hypothetical protein
MMNLLFLGLAVLLATSPLLLVATTRGGEGDGGGDESPTTNTNHSGEISGSVTITETGEVWLTALIDNISILAQVEIIGSESNWTGYRLSIVGVDSSVTCNNKKFRHAEESDAEEPNVVEFTDPADASNQIIQLLDNLGIPLSNESLRSIPHAIKFGWKSPTEGKQIVNELLDGNSMS